MDNKKNITEVLFSENKIFEKTFFAFRINKNKGILFLRMNSNINDDSLWVCDYLTDKKINKAIVRELKRIDLFELTFNNFYKEQIKRIIKIDDTKVLFYKKRSVKFFPILKDSLRKILEE